MINSVKFKNYRCFEDFSLNDLSRVNLLVGKNNSGKTSILEGLNFLQSGNWNFLNQTLSRRGWVRHVINQANGNQFSQYLNFKNSFFNANAVQNGNDFFSIEAQSQDDFTKIEMRFVSPSTNANNQLSPNDSVLYNLLGAQGLSLLGQVGLKAEISSQKGGVVSTPLIPLFEGAEVRFETLNYLPNTYQDQRIIPKSHYIFPESLDLQSAMAGWGQIAFNTNVVKKIIEILQLTKSDIEGLQPLQLTPTMPSSFYFKFKGTETPFPIGSMGDGVRRILYLLLSFPLASGGFVFIDEIETGIHYSLMKNMWTMVLEFAKQFDVQVFATTHSLDCIRGLAQTYNEDTCSEISIHRIENSRSTSTNYSQKEIFEAVNLGEEMRGV